MGMTSMKVRSWPSRPHHSIMESNSPSFTPLSATALIFTCRPAAFAAAMPSITLSSLPQRVISVNLAGSSVSTETLTRFTPQSTSSPAYLASWLPLVVRVSSSSAPDFRCRDRSRIRLITFLRTSGSPPVSRSLRTPRRTKALQTRSISSRVSNSAFGRKVMFSDMQ